MNLSLDQLADAVAGQLLAIHGDQRRTVSALYPLRSARQDGLTFAVQSGQDLVDALSACQAAVILCRPDEVTVGRDFPSTLLWVTNPRLAFIRVAQRYFAAPRPVGIHPSAIVAPDAMIASDAYIGPGSIIGNCEIGRESVIHGGVVIHDGTHIGARVVIHSGTVIGGDGFGFERNEAGDFERFPHFGGVRIEDDVEIGSNTSIDKGTMEDTIIRRGVKIDNLVHIAHNADVGEGTAIIAHAMVAGSVRIGPRAWIAPSACIMEGIQIGADALVGLGSVVVHDVPEGATVLGSPAIPAEQFRARQAALAAVLNASTAPVD